MKLPQGDVFAVILMVSFESTKNIDEEQGEVKKRKRKRKSISI